MTDPRRRSARGSRAGATLADLAQAALVLVALTSAGCGRAVVQRIPVPAELARTTAPAAATRGPASDLRAEEDAAAELPPPGSARSLPTEPAVAPATGAAPPQPAPLQAAPSQPTVQPTAPRADPPQAPQPRTASPQAAPAAAPVPPAGRTALAHLTVREHGGLRRTDEPVSHGVPFARGELSDAALLRAWRPSDGDARPIQVRPLSRWPDGSLRWVLVDSRVDLEPRANQRIAVGLAPDLAADVDPFTLDLGADGVVTLHDGARSWVIVGPADEGQAVAGLRAGLVDRFGTSYRFHVDPLSVSLIDRGPLHAVVALSGEHRALDPGAGPQPFHSATVHVQVQAARGGPGRAFVEWTLENTPLHDPPGRLAFRSYTLSIDGPADGSKLALPGRSVERTSTVELSQIDAKTRLLIDGKSAPPGKVGDLWMGLVGDGASLNLLRVESLQNHPAAMACAPGGPLVVGLLPAVEGREHFLDDATRKTFRLHLVTDAGATAAELMQRLADPAHVVLDPAELAASGAFGDAGHLYLPEPVELKGGPRPPRDAPTGWADWGEALARNTHQSGSPRNRLSVFLEALQSGDVELFRWARSRAWHAMDLRPFHIKGFSADDFPLANLYEGTPHTNEKPALRLGRAEMDGRFPGWKQGLPAKGHGYNGFDAEHMTLDDVYECWLLTGSWQALSALRSAGEAMLTWKETRPEGGIHSSRTFGWTLRALVQVHRATGDARTLDAARALVARADRERGRDAVKYLRRNKPDPRHIADREWDDPWMVAVAMHGLCAYFAETGDPLVPPMLTDLTAFCMSAFRGNGFLPDLPVDGSPSPGQVESPLGVSSWVPGAIAAAAFVTGDHAPVDALLGYYALLRDHTSRPVAFGGGDWHWWQPFLVSVASRHGPGRLRGAAR